MKCRTLKTRLSHPIRDRRVFYHQPVFPNPPPVRGKIIAGHVRVRQKRHFRNHLAAADEPLDGEKKNAIKAAALRLKKLFEEDDA